MHRPFNRIVLVGRVNHPEIRSTLIAIYRHLQQLNVEVYLDSEMVSAMTIPDGFLVLDRKNIATGADLVIVVGGDGSLLQAARALAQFNLPLLGINKGRLGFLTDIRPQELTDIEAVINGHYDEEQRFLLQADLIDGHSHQQAHALNDVVLLTGNAARMIEFEIYINHEFLYSQRADGAIIATPTGSTAYALSAGGPILHPSLNAIVLVPMFAHTLTSRPIVINGDSTVQIKVAYDPNLQPGISCDGQPPIPVGQLTTVTVTKHPHHLKLIHPKHYNYFATLRDK